MRCRPIIVKRYLWFQEIKSEVVFALWVMVSFLPVCLPLTCFLKFGFVLSFICLFFRRCFLFGFFFGWGVGGGYWCQYYMLVYLWLCRDPAWALLTPGHSPRYTEWPLSTAQPYSWRRSSPFFSTYE